MKALDDCDDFVIQNVYRSLILSSKVSRLAKPKPFLGSIVEQLEVCSDAPHWDWEFFRDLVCADHQASLRKYTVPITVFVSDAVIIDDRCLCVFFDHLQQDDAYRIANGGIIRPGKIQRVWKDERFWLLETREGN